MSHPPAETEDPAARAARDEPPRDEHASKEATALVLAWSSTEPWRAGEIAFFPDEGRTLTLGRGAGSDVAFFRQRPGALDPTSPLAGAALSREQLRITPQRGALLIENVGRCRARAGGLPFLEGLLRPGDTLLLEDQILLFCVRRPREISPLHDFPASALGPFGAPDRFGLLGESPAAFRARDRLAFFASTSAHVLLLGASGTGKELGARAIHALSARAGDPFVARNAASVPAGRVDAELLGDIGAAEGGTLFLDEIGELPPSLHGNLLRLLDGDGEHHRHGEATARRANVRVVAATNRGAESLRHDLAARLPLRLQLPGLDERPEDIPIFTRYLLRRLATRNPDAARRFATDANGDLRVDGALIEHLLRQRYAGNLRELEGLLWRAMAGSTGKSVRLTEELRGEALRGGRPSPQLEEPAGEPPPTLRTGLRANDARQAAREVVEVEPTADALRALVDQHDGNLSRVAQALGMNRHKLFRLLRKHGIEIAGLREGE